MDKRDATIAELYERIRARDDFLAVAAHELRNPLTPIKLLVQLLRSAHQAGDNTRLDQLIDRLEHQVEHFIDRMNLLLDVSQLTSGHFPLEPMSVNISELVTLAIEEHRPLLSRSGSDFAVDIEDRLIGNVDSIAVRQIVDNLLSNAIKWGQGKRIEVSLRKQRDHAELEVRDYGVGIAQAHCERIFERFERAVDRGAHSGFGIGLWVTRQLAEAMGGSIGVRAEKGKGSCFTVKLPLDS